MPPTKTVDIPYGKEVEVDDPRLTVRKLRQTIRDIPDNIPVDIQITDENGNMIESAFVTSVYWEGARLIIANKVPSPIGAPQLDSSASE